MDDGGQWRSLSASVGVAQSAVYMGGAVGTLRPMAARAAAKRAGSAVAVDDIEPHRAPERPTPGTTTLDPAAGHATVS